MPIDPARCRAARALLDWSIAEVAARSGVSPREIEDFERGLLLPPHEHLLLLRETLQAGGVEFIGEDDGRFGIRFHAPAREQEGIRPEHLNAANDG